MIKTTFWRQVVIAALLAGGSFTVAANPAPPPVSYGGGLRAGGYPSAGR